MKYLAKIILTLGFLAISSTAFAQGVTRICTELTGANGSNNCTDVSATNPFPISGSFSATTAGFNLAVTGTPFTATTGGATSSSFTSSVEVVVSNVGTTNAAYCAPGASATTSSQYIGPGSWFAFYAAGGITQVSCITGASTTTINLSAGAGLPTGAGGGGGGGGGGTVAQGTAASSGPWIETPWIAGAVNSATNGIYTNLLQGNAALSLTNPLFVAPSTAAAWTLSGPFGTSTSLANSISTVVQNGLTGTTAGGATPSGNNVLVVQGDAAMTPLLVDLFGHAGTIMDFAGQNATAPANSLQVGCEFNTTPTTITTGHSSPCQMDSAGNLLVKATPATAPSAIYSGQQTATTSAAALPSQAFVNGVILKSIVGNTGTIYIGPSTVTTSNGYPLTAGEAISYSIANSSTIYMIGTNATDKLAITGN